MDTTQTLLERAINIPDELIAFNQWLVWRDEAGRKTPYQASNIAKMARCNDSNTWSSFDTAFNTFAKYLDTKNQFTGLGFVFTENDPFTGIDLDDCVSGDDIHPEALKLIKQIPGYAEISPSLTGIKIFTKAKLPIQGTGKKTTQTGWGGALEIYRTGRYFTVTGRQVTL